MSSVSLFSVGASVLPDNQHVAHASSNCDSYYPSGAQQPVSCWWSTAIEKTGSGLSLGCVSAKGNPLGYYSLYTEWYGWSYRDARHVTYVGWFGPVFKEGPYHIVGTVKWTQCGTGA